MSSQASLVYKGPDGDTRDLNLETSKDTTIGRHPQCTLSVNQPSVSRRHARLWLEDGRWYVEDLSSSNGTYVNNRRIGEKHELTEGDKLRCGDFQMSYLVEDHTREVGQIEAPPPKKKPVAVPPRVVGSLSARAPAAPDAEAANRLTIGLHGPSDEQLPDLSASAGRDSVQRLEATAELTSVKRQLEENQVTLKRLEVENRDLKSQCSALTTKLAKAEKSDRTEALEEELDESREHASQLEERLKIIQGQLEERSQEADDASSDLALSELAETVGEVYRDLDELTSELRLKLKLAVGLLDDLNPLVQGMEKIRDETLPRHIEDLIREVVDGSDAADTMRAAVNTFAEAERSARLLRRMIRLLRDALRESGWTEPQR